MCYPRATYLCNTFRGLAGMYYTLNVEGEYKGLGVLKLLKVAQKHIIIIVLTHKSSLKPVPTDNLLHGNRQIR